MTFTEQSRPQEQVALVLRTELSLAVLASALIGGGIFLSMPIEARLEAMAP